MSMRRIIVTGGSGRAGQHVVNHLKLHRHTVLNVDFAPFPDGSAGINTMNVDLAAPGQVISAFAAPQFDTAEFKATSEPPGKAEAIVQLAARAGNLVVPDSETFKSNVLGTWNVLEASSRLGIKKVILASSETTHGVIYAQGKKDWKHFPLKEDYPVDPPDVYGTCKLVSEIVARSFHTRDPSMDIYILRVGSLVQPEDYKEQFPEFLENPEKRRYSAWSHIHARDLGQSCRLGAEKDGLGYQAFNAINDHITTLFPTLSTLQRYAPDVPIRREMGKSEAPFSNRKIKKVLGFKEEFVWRDQVPNLDEIRKEVEAMNGGTKA